MDHTIPNIMVWNQIRPKHFISFKGQRALVFDEDNILYYKLHKNYICHALKETTHITACSSYLQCSYLNPAP